MLDEIEITVTAGAGGNGIVSFRRERFVPRGGPDGGDGGRGGDVVIEATSALRVLDGLRRQKQARAEPGGKGGPNKRRGKNGETTVVRVPIGTIVWREAGSGKPLMDLVTDGQRMVVAEGGIGGRGNARLATSARRAPRISENGTTGAMRKLRIELRLLAEAGLVGLPNAGKSSLLGAVSEATPKVGSYPFTTLEPHLGVVERNYETVVVADIPGLIEGAHEGVGLGVAFLQHIRRTRLLVHVVDVTRPDVLDDIAVVRKELEAFGHGLEERPTLVALNKIDLVETPQDVNRTVEELAARGLSAFPISAQTGAGLDELMGTIFEEVKLLRSEEAAQVEPEQTVAVRSERPIEVRRAGDIFEVRGARPRVAAEQLGVESEEARAELARRLRRMGAITALKRAGVRDGDTVKIGKLELEWPV